jgi:spermidine/putrescine transport system ATP-binding protein
MTQNPIIDIKNVHKSFGKVEALKGVNLRIEEGEFFSLLGPSGCGKTTLLRMIAGFEEPTSGAVIIGGEPMMGIPANKRPTNMVFQSYAIFPHLSVSDNVGYGLAKKKMSRSEIAEEVNNALAMVDLVGYGDRSAHELSGGQRQRVALARALVMKPRVVLLDEPLSALDKKLREQMQIELRELQQSVGITFILVTHDQEEALIMSDRIAVLFEGEIAQVATPQTLYQQPVNERVASFIGVMNFLQAQATESADGGLGLEIPALGDVAIAKAARPEDLPAASIDRIGVRPEMLTILFDESDHAECESEGVVVGASYYGDMTYYSVQLPETEELTTVSMRNTAGRSIVASGTKVRIGWGADSIVLFS